MFVILDLRVFRYIEGWHCYTQKNAILRGSIYKLYVQLEPIIPFLVQLIKDFLLFIQTNNERIRPPNINPVIDIDFLSIYFEYIFGGRIRSLLVCIN